MGVSAENKDNLEPQNVGPVDVRDFVDDTVRDYVSAMGRLDQTALKNLEDEFVCKDVNWGKPWLKGLKEYLVNKGERNPSDIKKALEIYKEEQLHKIDKHHVESKSSNDPEKLAYHTKLHMVESLLGGLPKAANDNAKKKNPEKNKGILVLKDKEAYGNFVQNIIDQVKWGVGKVMTVVAGKENKWAKQLMEPWEQYRAKERERFDAQDKAQAEKSGQTTAPPASEQAHEPPPSTLPVEMTEPLLPNQAANDNAEAANKAA
ncbi:MAG: hypothetical protein WC843_03195 [Candidatus Gracilibacteria bacterium]|jgi:hypothetical protein